MFAGPASGLAPINVSLGLFTTKQLYLSQPIAFDGNRKTHFIASISFFLGEKGHNYTIETRGNKS